MFICPGIERVYIAMDPWQRNLRMVHHINEFLDLDSAKSNLVDEFIALFNAIREGLTHIDDDFQLPDSQINMLFLSKLKSRPEWTEWTSNMMRDPRVNASDPSERLSFREVARLARAHEKAIRDRGEKGDMKKDADGDDGIDSGADDGPMLPVQPPPVPSGARADHESEVDPMGPEGWGGAAPKRQTQPRVSTHGHLTQDEINAFVVRKMNQETLDHNPTPNRGRTLRGHMKRPSQVEINQFVVEQMREEQEKGKGSRTRSYSQPVSRAQNHNPDLDQDQMLLHRLQRHRSTRSPRCTFCGDVHPSDRCWRRWRVAAEAPHANFAGKRVEYRTEVPGQPPMYRTGFMLS